MLLASFQHTVIFIYLFIFLLYAIAFVQSGWKYLLKRKKVDIVLILYFSNWHYSEPSFT